MARPKSEKPHYLMTVDRAIKLLYVLADHRREMGVTEIAKELDVYPSVVSRLLATLQRHNLARQNPTTLKYQLGLGILQLSVAMSDSLDLNAAALPTLGWLNEITQETVFLMVQDHGEGIYIQRKDSPQRVAIQSQVGAREPLHASSVGKALLAHLPEDEVERILTERPLIKRTPNTITDVEAFRVHLETIRQQGYAIDDEEGEIGIRCIGAPVFDYTGFPVAAVSISGPSFRTPVEKLIEWSPLLLAGTAEISRRLGYEREPDNRQVSNGKRRKP